jgi:hypothetical protein
MQSSLKKLPAALFPALLLTLVLGTCDTAISQGTGPEQERQAAYGLTIVKGDSPVTDYVFPSVYPGYETAAVLEVEIRNTGTGSVEGITIGFSGPEAGAFTVSPDLIERLEAGAAASFRVAPQPGLGSGEYRAAVSVTGPGGTAAGLINIAFTVSATPLYGISLDIDGEEGYTFPTRGLNSPATALLTVTVTNTGNEETGTLNITLESETPEAFQADPASVDSIKAGETGTFTVQPKANPGTGTHTATVMVSGANSLFAKFNVSIRVVEQYIEIATAEELSRIGSPEYPANATYALVNNLTLENWTPITNTPATPFTGSFNGGAHTITLESFNPNVLNTDPALRQRAYIGVFGCIQGGRVENLTVDLLMPQEQEMNNAKPGLGEPQYIGGVSGYAVDTEFENITVTGDISLTRGDDGDIYLGGVMGYLKGGRIAGSVTTVNLTSQGTYASGGSNTYTGGLAGYLDTGEITRSRTSGAINGYSRRSLVYAGGAVGWAIDSAIAYTATFGNVDAGVSKFTPSIANYGNWALAGGITGWIGGSNVAGSIVECSSAGNITATTYAPSFGGNPLYAGGIVGLAGTMGNGSTSNLPMLISDCYSRGNVTAVASPDFHGGAQFHAGGIAGQASLITIQNSYAAGAIIANSVLADNNYTHAGGITAFLHGLSAATITIQNCAALSPQINWRRYARDDTILKRVAMQGVYTITSYHTAHGMVGERFPENTFLINNIANAAMVINYDPSPQQAAKVPAIILDPGPDTQDGADCDAKPSQSVFENTLGWDFSTVWTRGSDGYPVLRNAP